MQAIVLSQVGGGQRRHRHVLQAVALLLQLACRLRGRPSQSCSRRCLITQCRQPSEEGTWMMKLTPVVDSMTDLKQVL